MVEKHEARDLPVVLAQKSFDGVGLDREAIESAVSELLEVVGLEVLRAAVGGVRTGDVDPPKVIVLERNLGKHCVDGILDKLDDSAWILFIDLPALGFGDAEHAEGRVAIHRKLQRLRPNLFLELESLLCLEVWSVEQLDDFFSAACDLLHVATDHVGECP